MFELIVVALCAFVAAVLTLFSGFGLGTLLMPVVALFFPVEVAIAITAVVHLANNLFKVGLLGMQASLAVLIRFGIPALVFALAGALVLTSLADTQEAIRYSLFGWNISVTPVKLVIGTLILGFVAMELSPALARLQCPPKYLPVGGMLSGFFGGLSGHQGAFRSIFLMKSGLTKQQYVATSAVLAALVDISRISVYGSELIASAHSIDWGLVTVATLTAFINSYAGKRLLHKITLSTVRTCISALLVVIGTGMICGFL